MSADDGTLGMGMYGIRAGAELGAAYSQATAGRAQARYEASGLRLNARLAERNAADAIARGRTEQMDLSRSVQRLKGAQAAAYAGQGVDISTGTASDVLQDTDRLAREDMKRLANNAWREAYGYRAEAVQARHQADMTKIAARAKAGSTLATGGMRAARELMLGYLEYGPRTKEGSGIDPETGYPKIKTGH